MIHDNLPVPVALCGVLGLAILCLAILRTANLERRRHLGRHRLSRPSRRAHAPRADDSLAA